MVSKSRGEPLRPGRGNSEFYDELRFKVKPKATSVLSALEQLLAVTAKREAASRAAQKRKANQWVTGKQERISKAARAAERAVQRRWAEEAARTGRRRASHLPTSAGVVGTSSAWVRLIAAMEPGRWYGLPALNQLIGVDGVLYRGKTMLFLDKARNPAFEPSQYSTAIRTMLAGHLGKPLEPEWLWRLNAWGVAVRAKVLEDPTCDRFNILELEGARPDLWKKSRGGLPGRGPIWDNRGSVLD